MPPFGWSRYSSLEFGPNIERPTRALANPRGTSKPRPSLFGRIFCLSLSRSQKTKWNARRSRYIRRSAASPTDSFAIQATDAASPVGEKTPPSVRDLSPLATAIDGACCRPPPLVLHHIIHGIPVSAECRRCLPSLLDERHNLLGRTDHVWQWRAREPVAWSRALQASAYTSFCCISSCTCVACTTHLLQPLPNPPTSAKKCSCPPWTKAATPMSCSTKCQPIQLLRIVTLKSCQLMPPHSP